MRFLFALFLIVFSVPVFAQGAAAQQGQHVFLRLYADRDAAVPGETLRLAIEQRIVPGWHTYWTNPGDSGEPMRVKWDLPRGYAVSDLLWPAPERVPYGPLVNFGYSDHALMLADLDVPQNAKPGETITISGKATVLVCDEICIPETSDISLTLPVAASAQPANEALFRTAAARLPQPVDWATVTEMDANEVRVRITLPASAAHLGYAPEDIIWFPREWGYVVNAGDQFASYESTTNTLTLRAPRDMARDVMGLETVGYLLRVSDTESYVVAGPLAQAAAPVMGETLGPDVTGGANASFGLLLLFAFLGGVILNLMPCVFPVLSMKALHLVSLSPDERSHARASGLLYGAGVVVMFVILAGALLAIRAGGEALGWGFQLQNPAVVAGLAWLMFLVGLNLAGVFDLRVAFGGEMLLAEKHHPLVTSFLTGVLATLVATPCSAPFMATAMGAAITQSAFKAVTIFGMVGVGLAFPFMLLCFVPALQKILPRPGVWMETFRQILAFPMFASVVWLVWVVSQQGGPMAVGWTLGGMVALAFAIWLLIRQPAARFWRHAVMVMGSAVIIGTLASLAFIVPVKGGPDATETGAPAFEAYDYKTFDHALTDTDAPIFVNMTASWCITCLVNERMTLHTQEVRDLFAQKGVRYFKGDWTNRDPSITSYLQRFGRSGVPIYVYYGAPDESGKRPEAKVLPQILSVGELKAAME